MNNNISIVEAYYTAMGKKNLVDMAQYLHPNVQLISPFATITGKEAVLNSAKQFLHVFESLTIRAKCGSENQVMFAIDVNYPAPIGLLRTAVLVTIQDNLIASTELFHDTKIFDLNKDKITT